ncbi:hypothetical protein [Helicobacter cynogastricus]|uniref:hypothetical protein n=1 Tax=Helicobacter cynogastricus TaxID=329937 RepID=UPI000CF01C15|nr:hypothetical protein [Helicobacter cynogastricus]
MRKVLVVGFLLLKGTLLDARNIASYLDGGFYAVGLGLGGGNALQITQPPPPPSQLTNAMQAYKQNLQLYNKAVAKLKANKKQTAAALQILLAQLKSLNPTAPQLQNILKNIGQVSTNSTLSSVATYQNELNKLLSDYANANQKLLKVAETQFKNYQQALSQTNNQGRAILTNAIKTYQEFNTQISTIAKQLNLTPLTLPPLLQNHPNVQQFSPEQVQEALKTLAGQVNTLSTTIAQDIQKISEANQNIIKTNTQNLEQLTLKRQNAIQQALTQITKVSDVVGQAFHEAWMNYAVGMVFGLNNAQQANQTYVYPQNGKTYNYINNNFSCTFVSILQSMPGWKGKVSNSCPNPLPNTPSVPQSLSKLGFNLGNLWNSLFDLKTLQQTIPYLSNSNCAGGKEHMNECPSNIDQTRKDANTFFKALNASVGAPSFTGNFAHSEFYKQLEKNLNTDDFNAAQAFLDAYAGNQDSMVKFMLQTFESNPVWFMSVIPQGVDINPLSKPSKNGPTRPNPQYLKSAPENVQACYKSPTSGLGFGQNYYHMCDYVGWSNSIFLGYFGFLNPAMNSALAEVNAALPAAQQAIQNAKQATQNLNNFTPIATYTTPTIPTTTLPPQKPLPSIPTINTNPAPLPVLNKPQTPLISPSTPSNVQNNKLQTGLQLEAGYQKYFNPFVGLSLYGHLSYRYLIMGTSNSALHINAINHYGAGFGANFLFNLYSKIRVNKTYGIAKIKAYGLFAGLLGVYNVWTANFFGNHKSYAQYNTNINATFGLSMRLNRFKWMLGVRVPLTDASRQLTLTQPTGASVIAFVDNYKSASLFLNFASFY